MPSQSLTARAILFDMDGTLVDSTEAVVRVWTNFADRYGIDIDEIMEHSHGVRMVETVEKHAPDGADISAIVRELSDFELGDHEGIVALPGASTFLASLPASAVALVTSASRALATTRMAAAGLAVPSVLVTAEDVEFGKPRPDCYLLAAERLGVDARDCIVFEDADAGVRAGLAAGATVVVVGELVSDATRGLIRIPDYSAVTATTAPDGLTVRFA